MHLLVLPASRRASGNFPDAFLEGSISFCTLCKAGSKSGVGGTPRGDGHGLSLIGHLVGAF